MFARGFLEDRLLIEHSLFAGRNSLTRHHEQENIAIEAEAAVVADAATPGLLPANKDEMNVTATTLATATPLIQIAVELRGGDGIAVGAGRTINNSLFE